MSKKVLWLGDLYCGSMAMAAEFSNSLEYTMLSVVSPGFMNYIHYSDVPQKFNTHKMSIINENTIKALIDEYLPDIIIVRVWTEFANCRVPDHIFWSAESIARINSNECPGLLMHGIDKGTKALLTQNRLEIPYLKEKGISVPVGWFPRGVSHFWEKPLPKTVDVMATGSISPCCMPQKKNSFEMLVKPICENFPKESINVHVIYGREFIPWAKENFKEHMASESQTYMAQAKIFISPITTRFDPGILSQKTLQAMACKTLTITQHYTGVEDILGSDGENMIYADSSKECLEKIRYYLKHDSEREKIAERGYNFIHGEYNYTKIFKRAMKEVGVE